MRVSLFFSGRAMKGRDNRARTNKSKTSLLHAASCQHNLPFPSWWLGQATRTTTSTHKTPSPSDVRCKSCVSSKREKPTQRESKTQRIYLHAARLKPSESSFYLMDRHGTRPVAEHSSSYTRKMLVRVCFTRVHAHLVMPAGRRSRLEEKILCRLTRF